MFAARIVLDTVAESGKRITTIAATYPLIIHNEFLTHRALARNSASSRAIPYRKDNAKITLRNQVLDNPFVPIKWGAEQKGMQTGESIEAPALATHEWLKARDAAIAQADALFDLGVHKSLINRVVEPYRWMTTVMTATEWENFFRLRCHADAEIHLRTIAELIRDVKKASTPQSPIELNCSQEPFNAETEGDLIDRQWHLPFVTNHDLVELTRDFSAHDIVRISVARCARVSYLTHDGSRDPGKDLELFDRLMDGSGFGHYSPMEHVAMAADAAVRSGPFVGWEQYRKRFANENVPG